MLIKFHPQFLFDEDPATGGEPQVVEEETTVDFGDSPWGKDVQEMFESPEEQAAIHKWMQEKQQPYITKLEEEGAENRKANNLWNQFAEDPQGTFERVAKELYEDQAGAIIAAAKGEAAPTNNQPFTDSDDEPLWDVEDLPKEVQDLINKQKESEIEAAWNAEMNRIEEDFDKDEDVEFDPNLFYPFVAGADGDFDEAATAYKDWYAKSAEKFKVNLELPGGDGNEGEGDEGEGNDDPPVVVNSKSRQTSAPPQDKKYGSIDAAIDDFLEESNAPPPVVGST